MFVGLFSHLLKRPCTLSLSLFISARSYEYYISTPNVVIRLFAERADGRMLHEPKDLNANRNCHLERALQVIGWLYGKVVKDIVYTWIVHVDGYPLTPP